LVGRYASAFDFYSLLNLVGIAAQSFGIATVFKYTRSSCEVPGKSHDTRKEKALQIPQAPPLTEAKNRAPGQRKSFFTRNGANKILSPDSLKNVWFSVLLSNPLTKDDFSSGYTKFRFTLSCLFAKGGPDQRGDLQQPVLVSTRLDRRDGKSFAIEVTSAGLIFGLASPNF
jgi:hypothetical protein